MSSPLEMTAINQLRHPPFVGRTPNVAVDLANLAEDIDPRIISSFANATARNLAIPAPVAGMVSWNQERKVFVGYDGTQWVNQSPTYLVHLGANYGGGLPIMPGSYYTDPTKMVIPNLVNGQGILLQIEALIRIDGSSRQTIGVTAYPEGALQSSQGNNVIMAQIEASGVTFDEFQKYTRTIQYYTDNGTTQLSFRVDCGAGADRIVVKQMDMWATVYPTLTA